MSGTIFIKHLRSVPLIKMALAFCGVLVAACALLFAGFWVYMSAGPRMADMEKDLQAIQQGTVKPDRSGYVASAKNGMVYVTHAADGALSVLWPYNLAHDDNYFEGYLFEERPLTTNKVTAFGPFRGGHLNASPPVLTHLRVDRKISEHWYHVQGEMYK